MISLQRRQEPARAWKEPPSNSVRAACGQRLPGPRASLEPTETLRQSRPFLAQEPAREQSSPLELPAPELAEASALPKACLQEREANRAWKERQAATHHCDRWQNLWHSQQPGIAQASCARVLGLSLHR